jgi:hypothetical protein
MPRHTLSPTARELRRTGRIALLLILCLTLLQAGSGQEAWAGERPRDEDYGDVLFILTNDYEFAAGSFSTVEMGPPWVHEDNIAPVCADALAREYGGLVYVVGRAGCDHIHVLDPEDGFATLLQFSTGSGSNPQDICFVSPTRAFVTRYDRTELWEVDPSTGQQTDAIDLAPLADADGLPEMMGMAISGDRLYVALQRLDRDFYWIPVAPSYLAVIDLHTNELLDMDPNQTGVQGIPLAATNPSMLLVTDPLSGHILIGETGSYGVLDGGIERFDPSCEQSLGFVVTEEDLGGELNMWMSADMQLGLAITLSSSWSTEVVAFDMESGSLLGVVASSSEYAYTHLAVDPSYREIYVADASYVEPGLRVFDMVTFDPLTERIPVGLYPRWLLPLHGPSSGVTPVEPDSRDPAVGLNVWPQPAAGGIRLAIDHRGDGALSVQILDISGREIFRFPEAIGAAGQFQLAWDGRITDGGRAAAGVYLLRIAGEDGSLSRRIQFMR